MAGPVPISQDAKALYWLYTEWDVSSVTRDGDGRLTQIVITDGVKTKTIDITRDGDGRISSINETVA